MPTLDAVVRVTAAVDVMTIDVNGYVL